MSPYSFSTTHPLLFQKLQSEENLSRATTNTNNPVTEFIHLPEDVNEFNDLKTHPLFPKIQAGFLADILKLKELAHHYVNSHYDEKHSEVLRYNIRTAKISDSLILPQLYFIETPAFSFTDWFSSLTRYNPQPVILTMIPISSISPIYLMIALPASIFVLMVFIAVFLNYLQI